MLLVKLSPRNHSLFEFGQEPHVKLYLKDRESRKLFNNLR
mgnify:CR=1 FL=1